MANHNWTTPHTWVSAEQPSLTNAQANWRENPWHVKEHADYLRVNASGGGHVEGDVVIQDTTAGQVVNTTVVGSSAVVMVATDTIASSASGYYRGVGFALVNVQGTVAIGDALQTSATAKRAQAGLTGAFAFALTANASGAGQVLAIIDRAAAASSLAFGTPAIVFGTANAAGAATTAVRTDATLAIFKATSPTTLVGVSTAPSQGTEVFASRHDHNHGVPHFWAARFLSGGS